MADKVDPLLPLILSGHPDTNRSRAHLIAEAAISSRRDLDGFREMVLDHLRWAQAEALLRQHQGADVRFPGRGQPKLIELA